MERIYELIREFNMELGMKDGEVAIRIRKKPTTKEREEIVSLKSDIIAELQRRNEEEESREKAELDARLQRLDDIRNNRIKIKLKFHDGEYLSGYEALGENGKALEEIGLGKHVSGWGFLVKDEAVEALGEEFYLREAIEFMKPAVEKKEAEKVEAEAARQAKFNEAKATGKPVLLQKWTEGCCDPKEECDMDIHYEYAMPDGSVKREWTHTW